MMLIRDVIRDREPYSLRASATVQQAAEFMASRNIVSGRVVALQRNDELLADLGCDVMILPGILGWHVDEPPLWDGAPVGV